MSDTRRNISPLQRLVDAHEGLSLPVKVVPTTRVVRPVTPVTPEIVEAVVIDPVEPSTDAPSFSNFVVNISLSIDSKSMNSAMDKSAKIAKGIAASAAAMLGTAFILGGNQRR